MWYELCTSILKAVRPFLIIIHVELGIGIFNVRNVRCLYDL